MQTIRVVLVDDHRLFRDGLRRLLELEPDVEVIGEAKDGKEAVQVIAEKKPDVVLLDISMPKGDGVQVIRQVKNDSLPVRFLAITAYDDEESLSALSSAGVHGYLLKESGYLELISALRSVARGEPYVDPKVAGRLLTSFHEGNGDEPLCSLTPRERETFYWLSQGLKNEEIALRMVVSEKTVKNHVSRILKKLGLRDRTQAAIMAWRLGLAQKSRQKNGRA
ncbi:response regulator [Acetomicrobium sp. S15 = DSM 107314]|uniref:response regulator n=1 Tax=Acetomicrobium sp. S15 = DSM 107314 TaxID=2529858 RepID=UPI0018E106FC|nr:response regulator transcription factor [Acetomicrobium sp. S15 = DSM 107314]